MLIQRLLMLCPQCSMRFQSSSIKKALGVIEKCIFTVIKRQLSPNNDTVSKDKLKKLLIFVYILNMIYELLIYWM